jgi:hypothetical protein
MSMLRAGRDHQIIDLEDPDMFLYWSTQFDVEPEQLRAAVRAVGNRADDVRDYVERHYTIPVKSNTAH